MEKGICDKELKPISFAYAHTHRPGTEEATDYLPSDVDRMAQLLQSRRRTYIMSILAVWLFQIGFASIIIIDALKNDDLNIDSVPDIKIAMARFICGMVLHVQCSGEIQNGLKMMKYSVNHYWKFSNYNTAYLAGIL